MSKERNHYIYRWVDPNTNLPFYIGQGKHKYSHGKSKYSMAFSTHLINKSKRKAYCQNKADKLAILGTPHLVEIIHDDLTIDEANSLEMLLISRHGRLNIGTGILTNLTDGGEINPMNCPLVRQKQLLAVNSPSYIANKSIKGKIIAQNPEWIEWNKMMMLGKMNDPIYYEKWYTNFTSPENIEKLRETHKGTKILYNNVEYRSIRELARVLSISSQLLRYRIKNNIPLDVIPSKANRKGKDF